MSKAVFKNTLKQNWKLLGIFFAVLCFYLAVIITLIDPSDMEKVKSLFGAAGDFLVILGIDVNAMTSPLYYVSSTFFGTLVFAMSMIFYIIQIHILVSRSVEDCSLVYTLSAPITRAKFIATQGIYLILSMATMFFGILVTGTLLLGIFRDFDFLAYSNLVILTFLICTIVAMVSFVFSVAFCDTRIGKRLSTGVPIALLLMEMLGSASNATSSWLPKLTPFGWIESLDVVSNTVPSWYGFAFAAVIVSLLAVSILIFKRKRLPI